MIFFCFLAAVTLNMTRVQRSKPIGRICASFLSSVVSVSLLSYTAAYTQPERVVDIPIRPAVTQRFLFSASMNAKAAVILFAGGHGGMQIFPSGKFSWGRRNFLVRNRSLFADQGLAVVTIDAPSDRQKARTSADFAKSLSMLPT
jgi:hypothetical protein